MDAERWDILSAWLNEWLAADAPRREALRAFLAAEHPNLVIEADALAAASAELPGFLETPALLLASRELARDEPSLQDPPEEDPLLPAGSMVGPYRVAAILARGGMGDVYRATDVRLERDVALKVLANRRTGDPRRVERFMQEARVTAALDHPNVVKLFDVGRLADRAYLVAELLEGETLRARIERSALPTVEAVRIGAEIAQGLQAAHATGLVHRDLKPDNVFLTRAGATKILDFGIAKLAQDDTVPDGFSTLTGVVLGTAGYLAPEQIRGKAIDARADLFALGVVLLEMLTGSRAFAREHIVETLHAILHEDPPDLLEERDDVPAELAGIVARLLEKSPAARFQSAAELIEALRAVDLAVVGPRSGEAGRIGRAARAAKTAATEAVALTLAVMPFRTFPAAEGSDLLELGLADVLIGRLSQLAEVRVLPLAATERLRAEDPREAARRLAANRVLTGSLQRDRGFVRASVQLLSPMDERAIWATTVDTDASSVFSIQDIVVTRVIEELAPRLEAGARRRLAQPGTRSNPAFEAYLRGRVHVARPTPIDLRRAIELFREALELDPGYADAWAGVASAYKRMPVVAGVSADAFAAAKEAATKALELDPEHAEALSVLGTVAFWYEWDFPRAEELLRRALALQPSSADSQLFLAHLFSNIGRPDEALAEIRRARALDPAWPVPRSLEGQFLFYARRYEDAVAHLDALLEVAPQFWTGHLFRVYALLSLRRYDDAVAGCDRVFEIRRGIAGKERPYAWAVALKAYAIARLGGGKEAEAALQELRDQALEQYVPPHHEALVLHALGRDHEALAKLAEAVADRDVFVTFLAVDPKWDELRDTPAFRDLLSRANLLDISDRLRRSP